MRFKRWVCNIFGHTWSAYPTFGGSYCKRCGEKKGIGNHFKCGLCVREGWCWQSFILDEGVRIYVESFRDECIRESFKLFNPAPSRRYDCGSVRART